MNKLRVMVADDSEEVLNALVFLLKNKFEIVGTFTNGNDLVAAAISLHPDVIVSDITMPQLTGPQAMRELSARGHSIPFVFVSSDPGLIEEDTWSFVDKMDAPYELVPAVMDVASGATYISRRPRRKFPPERF